MNKTRKQGRGVATRGWKKQQPNRRQRTKMLKRCGKKCFLGTKKTFPICKKNTCKVSKTGVYSAYIRARQFSSRGSKYKRTARKAERLLVKMNIKR